MIITKMAIQQEIFQSYLCLDRWSKGTRTLSVRFAYFPLEDYL